MASSYVSSRAQSGKGSILSISSGGVTPTWTVIGEVKEVAFSGNTTQTVDVTNFESGNFREFISTICDSGTCKLSGNRVGGNADAGQALVTAAFETFNLVQLQIQLPKTATQTTTGDLISWSCLIQTSDFTVSVDKELDFSITTKNSGPIVTTYGT